MKLESLTIEHLRGAVSPLTLSFEAGKKLTIIFGENGTGKSTICDALDFIGKGDVGSLNSRGLGKTNKYWHSIEKTANDVSVRLTTSSRVYDGKLMNNGKVIFSSNEKPPHIEVLRRNQILNLVEAKAGERYNAIKHFIDVSNIEEKSESALRAGIRNIEANLKEAIARVQEDRENIERFWIEAGKPTDNYLIWAETEIKKDTTIFSENRKFIDDLKVLFGKLITYPNLYETQLRKLNTAKEELIEIEKSVELLNSNVTTEYLEILDILMVAQQHFSKHPNFDYCPLCESSENTDGLADKINKRIESQHIANQLRSLKVTLNNKCQNVEVLTTAINELNNNAMLDAEKFSQLCKSERCTNQIPLPELPYPQKIDTWSTWLSESTSLISEWNKISDGYLDYGKFINTLKSSFSALKDNNQLQRELEIVLPRLKQTLQIVEDERRQFTDEILNNISSEVGRLYELVHKGEGLNKINLELDSAKRASLEIATKFHSLDSIPPQAYFSDSHLDTLGLCVFLALAKMNSPAEAILVLDDVLGSIDEPHVDRLIEMLYEETENFKHCIVTTHYKPWKQKLRWGWLKHNECQFIELSHWTTNNGIKIIKSIPDVERLRILLQESPPDPQLVCAKSGVILEATLDFLTSLYECHVPRRADARYTLGDLLPAIDKKLKSALKVEHKQKKPDGSFHYLSKPLAPHLEEIHRISQLRNVFGCHFNTLSFELLDTDAVAFGEEVLALIDCLIDYDAGWPKNPKSGIYWATKGETRRLYPLKRPS